MPGGLIHLVTQGSGDLFLTGNPEITFFTMVYRRHTNFAIELKRLSFNDAVGFGTTSTVNISKIGDLIYRAYLEITIPEFSINRTLDTEAIAELTNTYNTYLENYKIIKKYLYYVLNAYRDILIIYDTEDIVYSTEIVEIINTYSETFEDLPLITDPTKKYYTELLLILNTIDPNVYKVDSITESPHPYRYDINKGNINLNAIISYFMPTSSDGSEIPKEESLNFINMILHKCSQLDKYYNNLITLTKKDLDELNNKYYKFAWVNRLGHSILDYAEFYIGGNKIDKQYGKWLDIWYELSGNKYQYDDYMEMIGDVPELTTFDRTVKPSYVLYIPLKFWFCKYPGLALPILALQYEEVFIRFKFRKFSECSYTELAYQTESITGTPPNTTTILNTNGSLDNIIENKEIDFSANLLIEYVYLDSNERKKFARAAHEYLIEQVQINYETGLTDNLLTMSLSFSNPCKGIVWVLQRENSLLNIDNTQKCLWTDYTLENANISDSYDINNETIIINKSKNPILNSSITLEKYDRVIKLDSNYFNYVEPYIHLKNSPKEGINSYWFSIFPLEHQPSGTCNCGYIKNIQLKCEIDPYFMNVNDTYTLIVYALSYNVLRIVNGIGNVAYI